MTYDIYDDNTAAVVKITESGLADPKYVDIPATIVKGSTTYDVTVFNLSGSEVCSSVTSMNIPSSLKTFIPGYFADGNNQSFPTQLPNLRYFYIDSNNQSFADFHNQLLLSKDKSTLICCPPAANDPTAVIFTGIKKFGAYAFNGCALQKLIIPSSLETVDEHAFSGFSGLVAFANADKNPNKKYVAYDGVLYEYNPGPENKYEEIQYLRCFPDSKSGVDYTCNLAALALNLQVADFAFDDVKNLRKINFSPLVTNENSNLSIGNYAFYNCKGLQLINSTVFIDNIGQHAFENTSIVEFKMGTYSSQGSSWGSKMLYVDSYAFKNSKLQSIIFPTNDKPEYMGITLRDYAMADCPELRNVSIGKYNTSPGVTFCPPGKYAFANCPKLESVNFEYVFADKGEYGVLPEGMFCGCTSLKSFKIEDNVVKEIRQYAFANCNLQSWPFANQTNTLETIGDFAFGVSVGQNKVQNHLRNVNLSEFKLLKSIGTGAFLKSGITNDLLSFYTENGKTSIEKIEPLTFAGNDFKKVFYAEGIKEIGHDAVADCNALTFVHLPNSLESIKWTDGVFYDKVRHMGTNSNNGYSINRSCDKLSRIEIFNNETYGTTLRGLLYNKKTMELIHCPEDYKVTTKAGYQYMNVNGLIIEDEVAGIKSLAPFCFVGSTLKKIVLPSTLETIGLGAFSHSNLNSLTIPSKVTSFQAFMFGNSKNADETLDLFMMPVTAPKMSMYYDGHIGVTSLLLGKNKVNLYVKKTAYEKGNYDEWRSQVSNLTYKIPIPSNVTKKYQYFSICRDFDINCGETNLAVYAVYNYNNANNVKSRTLKRYVPSRVGANHDKYVGAIMTMYKQPGDDAYYEDGNWYRIGEQDYASSKQNTRSDDEYLGSNFEYNWLVGCPIPTYVGVKADGSTLLYGLKYKDNKVSKWAKISESGIVPMNKAYLDLRDHEYPSSSSAKELGITFDDEDETSTTDIDSPIVDINEKQDAAKAVYYNLNGMKVEHPTSGIYVRNGKKVIIK